MPCPVYDRQTRSGDQVAQQLVPLDRAQLIFLPAKHKSWYCDVAQRLALVRAMADGQRLLPEYLAAQAFCHGPCTSRESLASLARQPDSAVSTHRA